MGMNTKGMIIREELTGLARYRARPNFWRFRSISRRQASQLPRRCDIPAARVLNRPVPFFIFARPAQDTR